LGHILRAGKPQQARTANRSAISTPAAQQYLPPSRSLMISEIAAHTQKLIIVAAGVCLPQTAGGPSLRCARFPVESDFKSSLSTNTVRACLGKQRQLLLVGIEQNKRRRECNSFLPETHELAVLLINSRIPAHGDIIPCRVIFVFLKSRSKKGMPGPEKTRARVAKNIFRRRPLLNRCPVEFDSLAGPPALGTNSGANSSPRLSSSSFGETNCGAARYFRWNSCRSTTAEQAALPATTGVVVARKKEKESLFDCEISLVGPRPTPTPPGLMLFPALPKRTAPPPDTAMGPNTLFTEFKQQAYVEQGHSSVEKRRWQFGRCFSKFSENAVRGHLSTCSKIECF